MMVTKNRTRPKVEEKIASYTAIGAEMSVVSSLVGAAASEKANSSIRKGARARARGAGELKESFVGGGVFSNHLGQLKKCLKE